MATRWDKLSDELEALDAALGVQLVTASGMVIGIVGDDWTPPPTTDPEAHVSFLEHAYDHTKEALERAKQLDQEARDKVKRTAKKVVDTGKELAQAVEDKGKELEQGIRDRAHVVKENFAKTAESLAPWYIGIGLGAWLLIGGVAYLLLSENKRTTPERMRVAKEAAAL